MSGIRLQPASASDMDRLAQGLTPIGTDLPEGSIETPETLAMLRDLADMIRADFDPAAWLLLSGTEIVGLLSLIKPPSAGIITIGYGIAPARRRRGHATAAVQALRGWAQNDARITVIAAETGEANVASGRVLSANGFACTGRRIDPDDGALQLWSLAVG